MKRKKSENKIEIAGEVDAGSAAGGPPPVPSPPAATSLVRLPAEEFEDLPRTSPTRLKDILVSPRLYDYRRRVPRADNDTLRGCRLNHAAIFEPDRLLLDYCVWPAIDLETGKKQNRTGAKWEAFLAANAGRTPITESQYEEALAIRDAVRADPEAKKILAEPGRAELTLTWVDEQTGIQLKGRLDWLCSAITDLKGAQSIAEGSCSRTLIDLFYDVQLAAYEAACIANGIGRLPSVVIWHEKGGPYDVAVDEVDEEVLACGRIRYRRALDLLAECERTKTWPGRASTRRRLRLPRWFKVDGINEETTIGDTGSWEATGS
jgi:hypothetical protein